MQRNSAVCIPLYSPQQCRQDLFVPSSSQWWSCSCRVVLQHWIWVTHIPQIYRSNRSSREVPLPTLYRGLAPEAVPSKEQFSWHLQLNLPLWRGPALLFLQTHMMVASHHLVPCFFHPGGSICRPKTKLWKTLACSSEDEHGAYDKCFPEELQQHKQSQPKIFYNSVVYGTDHLMKMGRGNWLFLQDIRSNIQFPSEDKCSPYCPTNQTWPVSQIWQNGTQTLFQRTRPQFSATKFISLKQHHITCSRDGTTDFQDLFIFKGNSRDLERPKFWSPLVTNLLPQWLSVLSSEISLNPRMGDHLRGEGDLLSWERWSHSWGWWLSPQEQLVGAELLLLPCYQLRQEIPCLVAETALYQWLTEHN